MGWTLLIFEKGVFVVHSTVHGLDKLPLSSVGAVVFGFTTQLSYSDLTYASLLLNDPNTLFLLEAPDATLRARTAGDAVVEIPCKTYLNGIRKRGIMVINIKGSHLSKT